MARRQARQKNSRDAIAFSGSVAAGGTASETFDVGRDATAEKAKIRYVPGHEFDVEHELYIVSPNGVRRDLIRPEGSDSVLVGDSETDRADISIPIPADSTVHLDVNNTDGTNSHVYKTTVEIDYMNGLERVATFLQGLLGRVK